MKKDSLENLHLYSKETNVCTKNRKYIFPLKNFPLKFLPSKFLNIIFQKKKKKTKYTLNENTYASHLGCPGINPSILLGPSMINYA